MIFALFLFIVGLCLSAFFSGSETGLYRVTRVRLVIDALSGDRIARGLLWLTNHPSVFVADVLIGNNIANYLVSLGVVIGAGELLPNTGSWVQILFPVLLSPIVFIYGESMPKNIFYAAPMRWLRRSGPLLLLTSVLFSPLIFVLWLFSKCLEWIVGESPQKLRLGLARRELAYVFEEGHDAGLLHPSQRALAQGLITLASSPVEEFATPAARMFCATTTMSKQQILALGKRHRMTVIPIVEASSRKRVLGYVQLIDLYLDKKDRVPSPRPLVDIRATDGFLKSLMRLQQEGAALGRVLDNQGNTVGYITARQLSKFLFRGSNYQTR